MKFTLTYEGPLATKPQLKQKHDIRRKFHPQIEQVRRQSPIKENIDKARLFTVRNFTFTALVHSRWDFRAELNILMLRPEVPGRTLVSRGDIDNRLKTLFDALTRPRADQDLPKDWKPTQDEDPLHCLLEDDGYITGVAVKTDRLLEPVPQSHVKLIIGVQVQRLQDFGGLSLLG